MQPKVLNPKPTVRDITKKFNKRALARFCGVTDVYIYYIFKGQRSPSLKLLIKMAEFFRLSTDEMIEELEMISLRKVG